MNRKRFKHHADILSRMFCGWQLYPDFDSLALLGDGELRINVLEGSCQFNGKAINSLSIAKVLESWFGEELNTNNISLNEITDVNVIVRVIVIPPPYGDRFTKFIFDIKSCVASGEDIYTHKYKDEQSYECKTQYNKSSNLTGADNAPSS